MPRALNPEHRRRENVRIGGCGGILPQGILKKTGYLRQHFVRFEDSLLYILIIFFYNKRTSKARGGRGECGRTHRTPLATGLLHKLVTRLVLAKRPNVVLSRNNSAKW